MAGELEYKAYIDTKQFKRDSREMVSSIDRVGDNTIKQTKRMDSAFKKLSGAIAGYLSFQAASSFVRQLTRIRGEFQQLNIALQTMLGSKEKADKLMEQVKDLAATTPFQLTDVAKGAKQLLAYGFSADTVAENLRKLGDLAAGVSAPLGDIVYLYGTMRTQGRAYAQDIRQFTNRGIPIVAKLAEQFGVAKEEITAMVSAGKVGFPEIEKAINSMTGEGGKFFNLMEKQSSSLTGQISNLQDQFEFMLNDLGKSSQGVLYSALGVASDLISNYKEIGRILGSLIATYGAYKTAVIALTAAQRISHKITLLQAASTKSLSAAQAASAITTKGLTRAWKALSAAMVTNPIGAAAVAIGALAGSIIYLNSSMKDTDDYISDLNKELTNLKDHNDSIDSLIGRYEELSNKVKLTDTESKELKETIGKLSDAFPNVEKKINSLGETISINISPIKDLNSNLREALRIALKSSIDDSREQLNRLKDTLERYSQILTKGTYQTTVVGRTGLTSTATYEADERQIEEARENISKVRKEYLNLLETIKKGESELRGKAHTIYLPKDSILDTDGNIKRAKSVKTVSERISELNKKLREQEILLSNQRSSSSTSSVEDIQDTINKISKIQGKLKILQGELEENNIGISIEPTEIISHVQELQGKIDRISKEVKVEIPTELELPQEASLNDYGNAVRDFIDNEMKGIFSATSDSLDSRIEGITKALKQGGITNKLGEFVAFTPAQIQSLKQAKRQLQGLAQEGQALWNAFRELPRTFDYIAEATGDVNSGLGKVLSSLSHVVSRAIDFGNSINEVKGVINNLKNDNGGLNLGNIISGVSGVFGAIGSVVGVVSSIFGAAKRKRQEADRARAEAIQTQNQLLERQLEITKDIYGVERIRKQSQAIDDAEDRRIQAAEKLYKTLSGINKIWTFATDGGKELQKSLKAAIDAGDWNSVITLMTKANAYLKDWSGGKTREGLTDTVKQMTELIQSGGEMLQKSLTGISVDNLTDDIVSMFASGKDAAEDFADFSKNVIKKALKQTFKRDFLQKRISEWYKNYSKALEENIGDEGNVSQVFGGKLNNLLSDAKKEWDKLQDVFGVSFGETETSNNTGLSGQISRSITEDTATELSGRINGMYLMTKKSNDKVTSLLEVQKNWQKRQTQQLDVSIRHLAGIESNTGKTANNSVYLAYLKSIDSKLNNSNDAERAAGVK